MSTIPDFVGWPSIQRLSSDIVTVTEKVDGSNGVIWVGPDKQVLAGSRNGWLLDGRENYGFAAWVAAHADTLWMLGEGYHYGEWFGCGIQRGYGLPEKRFASFEYWRDDLPICMLKVPLLYQGIYRNETLDEQIAILQRYGSKLVPDFMKPEGIVVQYRSAKGVKFKKFCENDLIPKSQQVIIPGGSTLTCSLPLSPSTSGESKATQP